MRLACTRIACLALLAAAPATAAERLAASLGGYMNAGIGYADPEGAEDDFGVFRDGEIHFKVRGASDNGLTFTARVELEAFTTTDQIDENWVAVSGGFGNLLIGGADTALNEHGGVGVVKPTGDYLNYYDGDTGVLPGDPGSFVGKDDSVSVRYWFSARGFEAGASWQPQVGSDGRNDSNALVVSTEPANDQFAVGANWSGDLGPIKTKVGGGWLGNDVRDIVHAGLEVGTGVGEGQLTLAGFWNTDDVEAADDLTRYGAGLLYAVGPWRAGGGATFTDIDGGGDESFVHVGGGYQLAPGVTTFAAVQWGENAAGTSGAGVYGWLSLVF